MAEIVDGGELPDWPDSPGVYIFVCAFPGDSDYQLGDVLYIGVSNVLRRRIGYALGVEGRGAPHGAQRPLLEFQGRGGKARVLIGKIRENLGEEELERALLLEYRRRVGRLPAWNVVKPKEAQRCIQARCTASLILDKPNVRAND